MLNSEVTGGASYGLPNVGRFLKSAARGFGRVLWAIKPGPVLLIIAAEAFVQACLATRLYYAFQGGTPYGYFDKMHDVSDHLISPFSNWDGTVMFHQGIFEISTIVAMDVYLFAGIAAIVTLLMLRTFAGLTSYVIRRRRRSRARWDLARAAQASPVADQAPVSATSETISETAG